jgi:hypothetical protein
LKTTKGRREPALRVSGCERPRYAALASSSPSSSCRRISASLSS